MTDHSTRSHCPRARAVPSPGRFFLLILLFMLLPACDQPDPAIARGRRNFNRSCAACHGQLATGLPGLGANLRTSEFVGTATDDELIAMIKAGKSATETHPMMPPKGGIPTFTDDDLRDIVAYIRSIRVD